MQKRRVRRNAGGRISRRRFLGSAGAAIAHLYIAPQARASDAPPDNNPPVYWWHRYPSFIQTEDPDIFRKSAARMVIHGAAKDPTWGPFGQQTSRLEGAASLKAIKAQGGRAITWIEGFGDCMLYAAAFNRRPAGTFEARSDDKDIAKVVRSHWDWAAPDAAAGNAIRWVGIHNLVDNEDFCQPLNKRLGLLKLSPTYPDGTPAVGVITGARYPLNHKVFDACGSKDLNGSLYSNYEPPANVNTPDPATGKPHGPVEGLYSAVLGKDDVPPVPGLKNGDTIYCGVISVHKDLSAPFWRQYVRRTIHEIVLAGLDGIWCDNYSPWDNFGYPPLQKAFGDWSVARFHAYMPNESEPFKDVTGDAGGDPVPLDVREYLHRKAADFGAKDKNDLSDAAWRDKRWLRDPMWNAYKCYRQKSAQHDLHEFYDAIHDEASRMGRPDFCIGGNDVPLYGLGWVRDTWQDMINTETTPGWHMGAGSRGIMIPPLGKMAIMYRAALEHQKGPFTAAWYYLNGGYEKHQQNPEIGKLLTAEAFANGAFLMCMPDNKQVCGTLENDTWWNRFVRDNEERFGTRSPLAEVGILFSPDNQIAEMAPGGYPDIDNQPHIFGHHGWATACIDAHYPYRAITDWKLTPAVLALLKALVVPHAESLSDSAISSVAAWTHSGGRLVLTGSVGALREPGAHFVARGANTLAQLLRVRVPDLTGAAIETAIGKGSVRWMPHNPGSDYYLNHSRRAELLPAMVKQLGVNDLVRSGNLPSTVGLFMWRSADRKQIFADLVNYDLDADKDQMRPAEDLNFSIRVPANWAAPRAETISPDASAVAMVTWDKGWANVRLPALHYFASVKLSV